MAKEIPVNTDPFISKVSLSNFKSVFDQEVNLGRLTLLVGENSSGKSSILQVIRLLQQSLQAESTGNRFPLNGDLIRMGSIDEIRTARKELRNKPVSIGAEILFDTDFFWGRDSGPLDRPLVARWNIDLDGVVPDEPGSTNITGLRTKFTIRRPRSPQRYINILDVKRRSNSNVHPVFFESNRGRMFGHNLLFPKKAESDLAFKGRVIEYDKPVRVSGLVLKGPLPLYVTVKRPARKILAEEWLNMTVVIGDMSKLRRDRLGIEDDRFVEKVIEDEQELIQFAITHINTTLENSGPKITSEELFHNFPSLSDELSQKLQSKNGARNAIMNIANNLKVDSQYDVVYGDITEDDFGNDYIREIFMRVKYLGPLREEPQFITLTSPVSSANNIGSKGEFTAAVLYNHFLREQELLVPIPDSSKTDKLAVKTAGLMEAINAWAKYLGLVEDISVAGLAALGLTIKVKPHGVNATLSLPSVGVGVSQLLPVLVICLLAEPGSVILLEQPELHLHPALQQRLADFFIAMSRSGRQLIVETHSEYIISRLRRRIVEEEDDQLMELVKIIFAERDRETGETKYRDVDLTPYGTFEEWPKGFFDQAAEEEREIIKGGLRKRAARDSKQGG